MSLKSLNKKYGIGGEVSTSLQKLNSKYGLSNADAEQIYDYQDVSANKPKGTNTPTYNVKALSPYQKVPEVQTPTIPQITTSLTQNRYKAQTPINPVKASSVLTNLADLGNVSSDKVKQTKDLMKVNSLNKKYGVGEVVPTTGSLTQNRYNAVGKVSNAYQQMGIELQNKKVLLENQRDQYEVTDPNWTIINNQIKDIDTKLVSMKNGSDWTPIDSTAAFLGAMTTTGGQIAKAFSPIANAYKEKEWVVDDPMYPQAITTEKTDFKEYENELNQLKESHPMSYGTGKVVGKIAELVGLKNLLASVTTGMSSAMSSAVLGGVEAATSNVGDVANKDISLKEYSDNIRKSAVSKAIAYQASDFVGAKLANYLDKNTTWTKFQEYARKVIKANAYSVANTGVDYLAMSEEQKKNTKMSDIGQSLLIGFGFSLIDSAVSMMKSEQAFEKAYADYKSKLNSLNDNAPMIKDEVTGKSMYFDQASGEWLDATERNLTLAQNIIDLNEEAMRKLGQAYMEGAFAGSQEEYRNLVSDLYNSSEMLKAMIADSNGVEYNAPKSSVLGIDGAIDNVAPTMENAPVAQSGAVNSAVEIANTMPDSILSEVSPEVNVGNAQPYVANANITNGQLAQSNNNAVINASGVSTDNNEALNNLITINLDEQNAKSLDNVPFTEVVLPFGTNGDFEKLGDLSGKEIRDIAQKFSDFPITSIEWDDYAGKLIYTYADGSEFPVLAKAPIDEEAGMYSEEVPTNALKVAQNKLIQESNPMTDDYHTGIRSVEDVLTFDEAMGDGEDVTPDFTSADIQKAKDSGIITVYSSKPIENGAFVSTSLMEAQNYAGSKDVYTKEVPLTDVAWIDSLQGQYAPVSDGVVQNSQTNNINKATTLKAPGKTSSNGTKTEEDFVVYEPTKSVASEKKATISTTTEVKGLGGGNGQSPKISVPAQYKNQGKTYKSIKELRTALMDTFSVAYNSENKIAINNAVDAIAKNGRLSSKERETLINTLYKNGKVTEYASNEARKVANYIKGAKIYVPNEVKAEFGDDWNSFRMTMQGNGVVLTNDSNNADVEYYADELNQVFPNTIDLEQDQKGMLEQIKDIVYGAKNKVLPLSKAEDITGMTRDDYANELDTILGQYKTETEPNRLKYTQNEFEQAVNKAVQPIEEREARKELSERNKVTLNTLKRLRKKLGANDTTLAKALDKLSPEDRQLAEYALEHIATNAQSLTKKAKEKMQSISEDYVKLMNAGTGDPNYLPDKKTLENLEKMDKEYLKDKSIDEINEINRTITMLNRHIIDIDKEIGENRKEGLSKTYNKISGQLEKTKGRDFLSGKVKQALRSLDDSQLTPMNYIERLFGWDRESEGYQAFAKQLEEGERKQKQVIVEMNDMVRDFKDKNADWVATSDGQGKKGKWYTVQVPELKGYDEDHKPIWGLNKTVSFTPAIKVELARAIRETDNLRHMEGGIILPDKELYSKGNIADAYRSSKAISIAPETAKKLFAYENLDKTEKELFDIMDKVFDDYSKSHINEVSQIIDGVDRAISGHYSRLYVDKDSIANDLVTNESIAGMPNMQSRKQSKKPIFAQSVWKAFEDNTKTVSKYYGLAIPVRNATALLNWNENGSTLRKELAQKFPGASDYIDELILSLSNPKIAERGVFDSLLNAYITATFGGNLPLVVKQGWSFPLVGSVFGFDTAPNPKQIASANPELIKKYTPELAYRSMGLSTPELAELTKNPNWTQKNKVTRLVFGGGIVGMDYETVKSIWPWAENYVQSNNPELEVGSEEYYQKVAEEYNDAVTLTQPMYDVMHRANIMKSTDKVVRAFTLFKTVPLQQQNTLRRLHGEAKAKGDKKSAKRFFNSIIGVIIAAAGVVGTDFLASLWKNKGKSYRSDDGELTLLSAGKQLGIDFAESLASNYLGGNLLVQAGEYLFADGYEPKVEAVGLSQLNDLFEKIGEFKETASRFSEGYQKAENKTEYADANRGIWFGMAKSLAKTIGTYFEGMPLDNLEKYIVGTIGLVAPEVANDYNDFFKSEYTVAKQDEESAKRIYEKTDNESVKLEAMNTMFNANKVGDKDADKVKTIIGLDVKDEDKGKFFAEKLKEKFEKLEANGITTKVLGEYLSGKEVKITDVKDNGYKDFESLKKAIGSADTNEDWHHIVEQTQKLTGKQINNSNNIVSIQGGADSMHSLLTAYYGSKQDFTNGKTVREWLSTKSFEEQWQFGVDYLEQYGKLVPGERGWSFITSKTNDEIEAEIDAIKNVKVNEAKTEWSKKGWDESTFDNAIKSFEDNSTQTSVFQFFKDNNVPQNQQKYLYDYFKEQKDWTKTYEEAKKSTSKKVSSTGEKPKYLRMA